MMPGDWNPNAIRGHIMSWKTWTCSCEWSCRKLGETVSSAVADQKAFLHLALAEREHLVAWLLQMHRVVVTAIVHRPRRASGDREFLILRRSESQPYRPGWWTVPGGGVDTADWHDEASQGQEDAYNVLLPALRREIDEECGPAFCYGNVWLMEDYAFLRDDGMPVLGISYVAEWVAGLPELNEENDLLVWATVEESKHYALIPDIHGEIERANAHLNTKARAARQAEELAQERDRWQARAQAGGL
jgi:8-oxo-dGTP pyrophosphatase MutT (NUDIX family)